MKKPVLYSEIAYLFGVLLLAVGNSLCAYGDWGMSMVVAPAYVLHLALVEIFPFFSFGVAEYTIQALIIVALIVMTRRVKPAFFLSFGTTLLYGVMLDAIMLITSQWQPVLWARIAAYAVGFAFGSAGVAVLFLVYFPPGLYEVLVKEIVNRWNLRLGVVKTVYDICSLLVAVAMSLLFFGELRGIGITTVICAFLNGTLIHLFGRLFHHVFHHWFRYRDAFPWRNFFEGHR